MKGDIEKEGTVSGKKGEKKAAGCCCVVSPAVAAGRYASQLSVI
jgi:hypothetical protein